MDSDDKKITQLPVVTSLSDSDLLVTVVNIGTAPQTKAIAKSNAITGGLTVIAASVTTSNVTGVEGTLHNLDVSGMTANRDFNLPTPSASGKRIGVRLSTGDDTYALILKINSVEWSRVFITGEIVIFVSTGTGAGDWKIEEDGRIPCMCKIEATSAQSISNATVTTITFNQTAYDNAGGQADLSAEKINIRRANKYLVGANLDYDQMPANAARVGMWASDDSAYVIHAEQSALSGGYPGFLTTTQVPMTTSNKISMSTFQNSGSAVNTTAFYVKPAIWIMEILPS